MSDQRTNGNSQLNTVLLLVATGLLSWTVYNTHEQSIASERIRGEIQLLRSEMDSRFTAATRSRWSSNHQKIWADELSRENPTIKVPDPAKTIQTYEP